MINFNYFNIFLSVDLEIENDEKSDNGTTESVDEGKEIHGVFM